MKKNKLSLRKPRMYSIDEVHEIVSVLIKKERERIVRELEELDPLDNEVIKIIFYEKK